MTLRLVSPKLCSVFVLVAQCAAAQFIPIEIAGPGQAIQGSYSGLTQPSINAQGEVAFTGFLSIPGTGTTYAVFRDDGLPSSPAVPLYLNVTPSEPECTVLVADAAARNDRCISYGVGTYAVINDSSVVAFETVSPADFTVTDIVSGDGGSAPRVLLQNATRFTFPTYINDELLSGDYLASGMAAAWFNQDSACQGVSLGVGDGTQLTGPQIGVPTADPTPFDEVFDSCDPPPLAGSTGTWDTNGFYPTLSAAFSPDGAWAAFNAEGSFFDGTARLIDGIFLANTGGTSRLELLYEGDVFLLENTPAVNASGSVVFLELNGLDYALKVVHRSNPGVATTIAEILDIATTSHRFGVWAINGSGTVAFTRDVTGGQGLFVYDPGSGSVTPVIQAGDAYDGGTVNALTFSKHGLNDGGELVVKARVVFPAPAAAQDYVLKFAPAAGVPEIAVSDEVGLTDDHFVDFGLVLAGDTATTTVTVGNVGSANLDIGVVSVGDPLVSAIFVPGGVNGPNDTCSLQSIPPGGSCQILVGFTPVVQGVSEQTLVIPSNDTGSNPVTVRFAGTSELLALVVLDPDGNPTDGQFDFGPYRVGNTTTRTFTLRNAGTRDLLVTRMDGIGAPFELASPPCGIPGFPVFIARTVECAFEIAFGPTALASESASIDIGWTDGQDPGVPERVSALQVSGEGVSAVPLFSVSDDLNAPDDRLLDFGTVAVGATRQALVTVGNTGGATLDVTDVQAPGAPYSVAGDGCTGAHLLAGEACEVVVRFAPNGAGAFSDSFRISYYDGTQGNASFTLNGTALASPLQVTNTTASTDGAVVELGGVIPGETVTATVTLTNVGGEPATLGSLPTPESPFVKGSDGCSGQTLPAGAACDFVVSLSPDATAATGSVTDIVEVAVTAPVVLTVPVTLNGRVGLAYDLAIVKESLNAAGSASVLEVTPGDAFRYRLTLTNAGPDDASGVTVTDVLPVAEVVADGDPVGDGGYEAASGVWTVGDVASGGSVSLEIPVQLLETTVGCVRNDATISAGLGGDTDAANDAATHYLSATGCADLEIVSVLLDDDYLALAERFSLIYTVTVRNNGPSLVTAVVEGFTIITSGIEVSGGPAWTDCPGVAADTTCTLELSPGQTATLTRTTAEIPAKGDDFAQRALFRIQAELIPGEVDVPSAEDPDPNNNTVERSDTINRDRLAGSGFSSGNCFIGATSHGGAELVGWWAGGKAWLALLLSAALLAAVFCRTPARHEPHA